MNAEESRHLESIERRKCTRTLNRKVQPILLRPLFIAQTMKIDTDLKELTKRLWTHLKLPVTLSLKGNGSRNSRRVDCPRYGSLKQPLNYTIVSVSSP